MTHLSPLSLESKALCAGSQRVLYTEQSYLLSEP
nr:MAG TPA: hypothetical protein [Caudoviricetes sp.]